MKKPKNRLVYVIFLVALIAILIALGLKACGGAKIADIVAAPEIVVAKGETAAVEISYKGESENASAEDLLAAAEKAGVICTVADTDIATIDGITITGVNAGETELTIPVGDLSKTVKITVVIPVEKVEAPKSLELAINGQESEPLGPSSFPGMPRA